MRIVNFLRLASQLFAIVTLGLMGVGFLDQRLPEVIAVCLCFILIALYLELRAQNVILLEDLPDEE